MNITIFKYRIFKVKSLMHLFLSQPRRWQIRIQLKLIPDIRLKPCPLCTLDFKLYSTSKYTHFWKTNLPIKFNLPFSAIGGSFTTFGRVVITLAISTTHLIWTMISIISCTYNVFKHGHVYLQRIQTLVVWAVSFNYNLLIISLID